MQVAARTRHEETLVVAEPYARLVVHVALFLLARFRGYRQGLVLEAARGDLAARVVVHVEEIEMVDRSLGLARHLVFICFECGTRLSHRVYDPQIAYGTLVGDDRGKVTRVGRPEPVDAAAFAVAQRVGIEQAVWLPVAEVLDPVGGDLRFDHGRVLLVLLELLVILARHAVEIHILGIDDRLAVGRYGCPAQLFGLLLLVLEVCKFTLFVVVREVEYLLALGLLGFLARKRILA